MATWQTVINKIQPTDAVSADVVNTPITALEERTDFLNGILNDISSTEFNYLKNVPVGIDVEEGHVVCWNPDENYFDSAISAWSDTSAAQGALVPANTSYIQGILVKKHTPTSGAIITSGYIRGFGLLDKLFGTDTPESGLYYLSSTQPGQVTITPPPLSIATIHYDGLGNVMFLPSGSVVTNHRHNKYKFEMSQFKAATPLNFPNSTIPENVLYGYTPTAETQAFFQGVDTNNISFVDDVTGTIIKDDAYIIEDQTLWLLEDVVADLTGFAVFPFVEGTNLVDRVTTDTPDVIQTNITNGELTINKRPFTNAQADVSLTCVSDITDDNVKIKTPVVNNITAGLGISVSSTSNGSGSVEISSMNLLNSYIDAQIVNLNNAVQRTVGSTVYTVLPGGRVSSVSYSIPLPYWEGASRQLKFSLWVKGGDAALSFTLDISKFSMSNVTGETTTDTASVSLPNNINATDPAKHYLYEVTLPMSVDSSDLIQVSMSPTTTPVADVMLLRQGVKII